MKEITKEEFYNLIGPLDVVGHITNNYEHKGRGYVMEMRARKGQVVAIHEGGDFPFTPKRYFQPTPEA